MQKNSDHFSMENAMRIAQSKEGQQLLSLLRSGNSKALDTAMSQAAAGEYGQAKQTLSSLLSSPEIRSILEKMGRSPNE